MILLAAGASLRFGGCKAAALIQGLPVLEHSIRAFRDAGIASIVVVAGAWKDEVERLAEGASCLCVANARHSEGMFSSLLAGLEHVKDADSAFFVHPADIPMIAPATVSALAARYPVDEGPRWIVPTFAGREGHPVLLPRAYKKELPDWNGPDGLRGFLRGKAGEKISLPVPDEGILMDLDVPSDLEALRAYARRVTQRRS